MTPFQARLLEAERRMADLEARVRGLGSGARERRQAAVTALVAGENLYRQPPPWLPVGGPAMAQYRTTACGGPASGTTITTKYQGLVLDERRTTGDGYAIFWGVEGVPYTYEVTAPGSGLRATSGTYTMPTGGIALPIALGVLAPTRCLNYCGGTPARPPYRFTDPAGSFVRTDDILNGLTFTQNRNGTDMRFTISILNSVIQTYRLAAPGQGGIPPGDSYTSLTVACWPWRVTAVFGGLAAQNGYGTPTVSILLELA